MSTSSLPPDEIRAAAEVHRELGPEYGDAVVDSFLARVDEERKVRAAARTDAKVRPAKEVEESSGHLSSRYSMAKGMVAGTALTGIPLTIFIINLAQQPNTGGYPAKLFLVWVLIVAINLALAGWQRRPPRNR